MAKIQVQIGMKVRKMKISPSKPVTVFKTNILSGHVGKSPKVVEHDAKGEANVQWSKCENYQWVWENAVANSITFHAQLAYDTLNYSIVVTAEFEPEDLTYYLMKFGV